jgi:hypothetical protein
MRWSYKPALRRHLFALSSVLITYHSSCPFSFREAEPPINSFNRGICPIIAKLFLRRRAVEGLLKKNKHLPTLHSAMGWGKYGYINQMVKLASHRFQGIAGRSNIERPTPNAEWEKMKKQNWHLDSLFIFLYTPILK